MGAYICRKFWRNLVLIAQGCKVPLALKRMWDGHLRDNLQSLVNVDQSGCRGSQGLFGEGGWRVQYRRPILETLPRRTRKALSVAGANKHASYTTIRQLIILFNPKQQKANYWQWWRHQQMHLLCIPSQLCTSSTTRPFEGRKWRKCTAKGPKSKTWQGSTNYAIRNWICRVFVTFLGGPVH